MQIDVDAFFYFATFSKREKFAQMAGRGEGGNLGNAQKKGVFSGKSLLSLIVGKNTPNRPKCTQRLV